MTSLSFQQEKELDYYKEENRKLAGRIDELISMNNTMKEMIKQKIIEIEIIYFNKKMINNNKSSRTVVTDF